MNPTQLTVDKLRKAGWLVANVEKYNAHTKRKNDLFGFIDLLAIKGAETLAIQVTTDSHIADRVKKIIEHENFQLLSNSDWQLQVWGWKKQQLTSKKNTQYIRYLPRIIIL